MLVLTRETFVVLPVVAFYACTNNNQIKVWASFAKEQKSFVLRSFERSFEASEAYNRGVLVLWVRWEEVAGEVGHRD